MTEELPSYEKISSPKQNNKKVIGLFIISLIGIVGLFVFFSSLYILDIDKEEIKVKPVEVAPKYSVYQLETEDSLQCYKIIAHKFIKLKFEIFESPTYINGIYWEDLLGKKEVMSKDYLEYKLGDKNNLSGSILNMNNETVLCWDISKTHNISKNIDKSEFESDMLNRFDSMWAEWKVNKLDNMLGNSKYNYISDLYIEEPCFKKQCLSDENDVMQCRYIESSCFREYDMDLDPNKDITFTEFWCIFDLEEMFEKIKNNAKANIVFVFSYEVPNWIKDKLI